MSATSIEAQIESILNRLSDQNQQSKDADSKMVLGTQPIHTMYGGAHLFRRGTIAKISSLAAESFKTFASDGSAFNKALGVQLDKIVFERVSAKMNSNPVQDYRIDFEDGYGYRDDEEEDEHALVCGIEVAAALHQGALPQYFGVRIKPLGEASKERAIRTLELFLTSFAKEAKSHLPHNFVVTLPKVENVGQVTALAEILSLFEASLNLPKRSIKIELMAETPQFFIDKSGTVAMRAMVEAGGGRCRGVHFGAYDYTAACGLVASAQTLDSPACDFARRLMQLSLAGTGVWLSDGATTVLPLLVHRTPTSDVQKRENAAAVQLAWKLHFENVLRALNAGFYQGWDLHPAQMPARYAAVYSFFLQSYDDAARRLKSFIDQAAQATSTGTTFDDAATAQGLVNYFLRGFSCGALSEAEIAKTGLTLDDLEARDFSEIVRNRRL